MSCRASTRVSAALTLLFSFACAAPQEEAPAPEVPAGVGEDGGGSLVCNTGELPGNVILNGAIGAQPQFDQFGWQTFTYVNNTESGGAPLWTGWSSTVDLLAPIQAGDPVPAYGTHYYPDACQAVAGYQNYRVLDQVDKVNDSLFEAQTQGLSGKPVVDSNGNFLRYEILISEATYDDIVSNQYYEPSGQAGGVSMLCAADTNTGPADPASGAMNLKLAWMEDPTDGGDSSYYSEQFLVYTPADLTGDNTATCELGYHRLVGMHIARKTIGQQAWLWSTFEQVANAPDCTAAPPGRDTKEHNTSCPAYSDTTYNLMPSATTCADGACADCNTAPAKNCSTAIGYCVHQGPAATAGLSALCRQVSSYETDVNTGCKEQMAGTVWANYDLISTQWFASEFPTTCGNQSAKVYDGKNVQAADLRPQVTLADGKQVPYLANTSMESYERSNCMGCHSKSLGAGSASGQSADFVYYLMLEVEDDQ